MFCEKCGQVVEDGALFCENCGTKVVQEQPDAVIPVQPVNQPAPAVSVVAPAPKKPISMHQKIIIIALVVVVALFGGLYCLGNYLTNPERVAEKIFMASMEFDYDKLYDYLDVPDGDFLTKDMFVSARKEALDKNSKTVTVQNFSITQEMDTDSILESRFKIDYTVSGGNGTKTEYITLIKNGKKFLFFDNYKMYSGNFIQEEIVFSAPKDMKVSLNGIELTNDYLLRADDDFYDEDEVKDYEAVYEIPALFTGIYELTGESKLTEDYKKDIKINYSCNEFTISDLEIKKSVKDELIKKGNEFIDAYCNALVSRADFSTIKNFIVDDEDSLVDIQDDYQEALDDADGFYILDSYTATNDFVNGEFQHMSYEIKYASNYTVQEHYNTDEWPDYGDEPIELSGTHSVYITFSYVNDTWLVSDAYNIIYY